MPQKKVSVDIVKVRQVSGGKPQMFPTPKPLKKGMLKKEFFKAPISKSLQQVHCKPFKRLVTLVAIILIVLIVLWLVSQLTGADIFGIKKSKWQAVFLSNGQVYFGRVVKETSKNVVLREIYYLQVAQPIQPGEAQAAQDLSLVKLGNELHGPMDEMRINRQQVLFIEDLRKDSKVVQAISQYKTQ